MSNVDKDKRRAWDIKGLARRRKKYNSDPEYRKRINDYNNQKYRERSGAVYRNCGENLAILHELGKVRVVDQYNNEHLTFTVPELTKVLGNYTYTTLLNWHKQGIFPLPRFTAKDSRIIRGNHLGLFTVDVYLEHEVRAIVSVFDEYQENYIYLMKSKKHTINKLNRAVAEVRENFYA